MPLPATPLRRSEKKRPPAPPTLIGKLQYGQLVSAADASGKRYTYRDWTTDPADSENLLRQANADLGIHYRGQEIDFGHFSFQPQEIPILYLTGHEGFSYSDAERQTIARFLHDGGTLIGDACCGQEPYRRAFLREINGIFPDRKMKILAPDHPVYTAFHTLSKVQYQDEEKEVFEGPPVLEGVSLGCREAVFLSQYDLSCGWDGHRHEKGKRIWPAEAALRLGVNMIAYCLATYRLGQYLATTAVYRETAPDPSGGLVIGQICHSGDWDPNPSALATLLKYGMRRSSLAARFQRQDVSLAETADLPPMLYLTGHDDFAFSASEAGRLRAYLQGGGFLFADACCGRAAFDQAFRRELRKVLPDHSLAPLKPDHPLLRLAVDASAARGTAYLDAKRQGAGLPALREPQLEAISLGTALT
ncbi:MAG: DUF4159 domain-containing protein, partial [Planctomycetota bacterium]|nr:DUF4159 domain-containing protein [Planctomycetota bacterium]